MGKDAAMTIHGARCGLWLIACSIWGMSREKGEHGLHVDDWA